MSIADIILLSVIGLWAAWVVFALIRRRLQGKGCCCAGCSGGCSSCTRASGKRQKGKRCNEKGF